MTKLLDLLYAYMFTLGEIYGSLWKIIDPNSNLNTAVIFFAYGVPVAVSMFLLFRKKESINGPVYEVIAALASVIPSLLLASKYFLRNAIGSPIKEGEAVIVSVLFALSTLYFSYTMYRMMISLKKPMKSWRKSILWFGVIYGITLIPVYVLWLVGLISFYF